MEAVGHLCTDSFIHTDGLVRTTLVRQEPLARTDVLVNRLLSPWINLWNIPTPVIDECYNILQIRPDFQNVIQVNSPWSFSVCLAGLLLCTGLSPCRIGTRASPTAILLWDLHITVTASRNSTKKLIGNIISNSFWQSSTGNWHKLNGLRKEVLAYDTTDYTD